MSEINEEQLIETIKNLLKGNEVVCKMFNDYGVSIEKLDEIPIEFAKLKVSAKTKNRKVMLNENLLDGDNIEDASHYIIHEICHWLQQGSKDLKKYKEDDAEEYLDLKAEVEAFQYQIAFMKTTAGEEEAEEYVEDLLDFHEFDGAARKRKKEELMEE